MSKSKLFPIHLLVFFIMTCTGIIAQDTWGPVLKQIRFIQSFTYFPTTLYSPIGYPYHTHNLQSHSRLTVSVWKNLSAGINSVVLRSSGTYLETKLFHLYGPIIQWHSREQDGFTWFGELGYLHGDYFLTAIQPERRLTEYFNAGGGFSYHFHKRLFFEAGAGAYILFRDDEEALKRSLFFYRLGFGYRILLEKKKS